MIKTTELLYVEDFPAFVAIGREMHDIFAPYEDFDEQEILRNLYIVVNDISRSLYNVWISKDGDKMIGFGCAAATSVFYSKKLSTCLVHWYVTEKYRTTFAGFQILHMFEQWSRLQGAFKMEVGALKVGPDNSMDDVNKINRMLNKRGFIRSGEVLHRIV